jgi:hypothetical protein
MVRVSRFVRIAAFGVVIALLPGVARAQDKGLRAPTVAASAAAAADWASTYYAVKYFKVRELNPFLQPMQGTPGRMISMGAVMDAGIVSAWNLGVGRKNQRLAAAGLWTMTAFRAYLAIHNLRNTRKAERRVTPGDRASLDASTSCTVPLTGPACAAADRTVR